MLMKRFIFVFMLGSIAACTTMSSKITYDQFHSERDKDIELLSQLLNEVKAQAFAKQDEYDKCFANAGQKIEAKTAKALVRLKGPQINKLSLADISYPKEIKDRNEFGQCVRLILNRINLKSNHREAANITVIIQPSWGLPTKTTVEPSGFIVPSGQVCVVFTRSYFKIKPGEWSVYKSDWRYVFDSAKKIGDEQIIVCGDQDLRKALRIESGIIQSKFPNEDLNGFYLIDGFSF